MKFGGAAVTAPTRIGGELYSRRQIKKPQIINVSKFKMNESLYININATQL